MSASLKQNDVTTKFSPEKSPFKPVFERATWPTSYNMVHKPIYKAIVTFLTRGWDSNVFLHTGPMWYNLVHQTIHLHALAPWPNLGRSGTEYSRVKFLVHTCGRCTCYVGYTLVHPSHHLTYPPARFWPVINPVPHTCRAECECGVKFIRILARVNEVQSRVLLRRACDPSLWPYSANRWECYCGCGVKFLRIFGKGQCSTFKSPF